MRMSATAIAMLPRGTAFIRGENCYFNPIISDTLIHGVQIWIGNVGHPLTWFDGFRLPEEVDLRSFEVSDE